MIFTKYLHLDILETHVLLCYYLRSFFVLRSVFADEPTNEGASNLQEDLNPIPRLLRCQGEIPETRAIATQGLAAYRDAGAFDQGEEKEAMKTVFAGVW